MERTQYVEELRVYEEVKSENTETRLWVHKYAFRREYVALLCGSVLHPIIFPLPDAVYH